jgi:sec-independent protein translocase protein TatA
MPNIGTMEIILVLIVALIVFGPKKLPELGKSLGKGINEFKGSVTGGTDEPARVETHAVPVPVAVPVDEAKAPRPSPRSPTR